MGAEKKISKNKKLYTVLISVVTAIAVFISIAPDLNIDFISWQKVYKVFGVASKWEGLYQNSVHFINVGEGDCTLIRSGDFYIMIDVGPENYFENIDDYLIKNNIKTINYLIITHPHADHMGGAAQLIENYNVENIIMRDLVPEDDMASDFQEMQSAASGKNVNEMQLDKDYEFTAGEANFNLYLPVEKPEDYNEGSIITKITLCGFKVLIMADAGFDAENVLMWRLYDVSADILRVGHHGSKYSTSEEFLSYIKPKYAVISVGINKFSHPSEETVNRLQAANISWFRTDTSDGIYINFYNDKFELFTVI